jgi:hypothetical protein
MKIPKTIKIGGHKVKIIIVDKLKNDIADCGMCQVAANKIWIATHTPDDEIIPLEIQVETLLHEILHFLSIQGGFGVQEKIVTSFASGLYQVIKDNKLFTLWERS